MPLLVVPIAPEDADLLTLAEWDALVGRATVAFEDAEHPLKGRLAGAEVTVVTETEPLGAGDETAAVVVDPRSPRLVDFAKQGAEITTGVATAPDALTAAHGAYLSRRGARALASLGVIMARLRSADGCPWDQEQTHESLRIHLLEESYEVLEAIDRGELGDALEEELGDLLLQVAFHAQLAADDGRFDLARVAERIVAKLVHRHPHVFGDRSVADADEVVRNWETIKKDEKEERTSPFDGVPPALPALLSTYKIQKRAAALGFSPTETEALDRLTTALEGEAAVGTALFWLVAVARARGVDPEGALREALADFRAGYENA